MISGSVGLVVDGEQRGELREDNMWEGMVTQRIERVAYASDEGEILLSKFA